MARLRRDDNGINDKRLLSNLPRRSTTRDRIQMLHWSGMCIFNHLAHHQTYLETVFFAIECVQSLSLGRVRGGGKVEAI